MKNYYKSIRTSLIAFLMLGVLSTYADVFHSTTAGGNWDNPATWDEVAVPTATDDVIITGPGSVIVYNNGYSCNNLTVNTGATLINRPNGHRTLTVTGDITNNGIIQNSNYQFTINVEGDISNNAIWTNHITNLTGSTIQYISCAAGQEFGCLNFVDTDNTSTVEALTDLTFSGTGINFNNGQLVLPVSTGGTLTLHGGSLDNIDLITNSGILSMDGGAVIWSHSVIHNATLEGTVIVRSDPVTFEGETINNGILINPSGVHIYWCYIDGNITNNGIIQDSNYDFHLRCNGNITNSGEWSNDYTEMMDLSVHEIYQGGMGEFTGERFYAADTTGTITVMTDFNFNNTKINLNGVTLELDNSKGANLSVVDEYLYNGTLQANGQNLYMNSTGNEGYLQDMIVENVTLKGVIRINLNGVVFNGNTVVEDTLQTRHSTHSTLTINDLLINNGLIRNSNTNLYLNVYGDIVNNGEWINTQINMAGTSDQYISCLNGHSFGVTNFNDSDNSSKNICADNVSFSGTNLNLSGGRLDCDGYELEFINTARVNSSEIEEATLSGTVYVDNNDVHFYGQITNNGILRNFDGENTTTYFHNDIINNGSIIKSNYNFHLYFYENIINNGVWTFSEMHMASPTNQYLTLDAGQEFACIDLINDDPTSAVEALTDLTFSGTKIDFNNGQLIMPVTKGGTLTLHGGYLYRIDLITNSGALFMDNNALLWDQSIINNATLDGTVIVRADPVTFKGETVNNGTLINPSGTHIYWCYIDGNITNNGIIQDSNYDFHLRCNGNITNSGEWSNDYTEMMDLSVHEIYQGGMGEFTGERFYAADTTGTITVMTDFNFNNTKINLNGVTLELDNSKGANLSVVDEYLYNGTLQANGQNLYMNSTGNEGYLQDMIVENVTLKGVIRINLNGVVFNGNTVVEDTLQTRHSVHSTLTINDLLTNNGLIRNSNYQLYINIFGDIVNNGIWTNNNINMSSASDQYISCLNGNVFSVGTFSDADNSSLVLCANDVGFNGTNLYLTGGRIVCEGYELGFINNARVNSTEIEDAVLTGTVYVDNNDVHLYGKTTNNGTIRNYDNEHITTNIHGDIFNNGTIMKSNYNFYIECEGHIVNNGTWTNNRTTLNGDEDQLIYLINNQEITGQVYFDALDAGAPYQWYFDLAILDSPDFTGETANDLIWQVPVSEIWYGDFHCETGAGSSRKIVISGGVILDVTMMLEGAFNGADMNTTLNDNDKIPLAQPYNVAPWNYAGSEIVSSIPVDAVDWVLVEFRETAGGPETATSSKMIHQRALFLRNDGVVVDLNGTPEMKFDVPTVTDNLYMVVWHRNHLGTMTANPISLDIAPIAYDFSSGEGQAYGGSDGQKDLGGGIFGLMGGEADDNQEITEQDKLGFWTPNVGTSAEYETFDFNMDNKIDNLDKNEIWVGNNGQETQVPD